MKNCILALTLSILWTYASAQTPDPNKKFPPQQLKADLAFVQKQLFDAHADPFTELSKPAYEKVFADLDAHLIDSMTATAFFKVIRPCIAHLSDEHALLSLGTALQTDDYKNGDTFLPFTLSKKGNNFLVDELLADGNVLKKGDVLTKINGEPIAACVANCADYTNGFPSQRANKALDQFGYLYTISHPNTYYGFEVRTASGKHLAVKGTNYKTWLDHIIARAGQSSDHGPNITYTRYGNAGYINTHAFEARNDKEMDSVKAQIAGMFKQIKSDGVTDLFIDVSRNGGGNSAVGDVLIDHFCDKPYRAYQCNFKRSDEYLGLIRSWGIKNEDYEKEPVGKVIHYDAEEITPTVNDPDRFKGKVYVVVGNGTFSSAIMFATTIKDNHLATLIGQVPADGHPDHFGELYNTKLPNTGLELRFGVKEWIRPAGKSSDNVLHPDILVTLDKTPEELIKAVIR